MRPVGDAWLVSGSIALLDGPASPSLVKALGWDAPPSANVLASQLQQLGRMHPKVLSSIVSEKIRFKSVLHPLE